VSVKRQFVRKPVEEGLPPGLPPAERRSARMRLVASRRLIGLTVVLDGVHDPHNISAVLRSCDGFGIQHVHILGESQSLPVNPAITRGCHKWLTIHYHLTPEECAEALRRKGFRLWAAVPERNARPLHEIDFSRETALLFGAERDGFSAKMLELCDERYFIPMAGFSQSLNISVAAAVSLYVGACARRAALGGDTDLSPGEVAALTDEWAAADRCGGGGCCSQLEPKRET